MKWAGQKFIRAVSATTLAALMVMGGTSFATVHTMSAYMNGAQEVPPRASQATGSGIFMIDDVANTVSYNIQFDPSRLTSPETAAHIHCCAPPDSNAGVIIGLPLGSPKIGMGATSATNIAQILAGRAYVNIHTQMFSGGEIRGQIVNPTPVPPFEPSSWGSVKALYR